MSFWKGTTNALVSKIHEHISTVAPCRATQWIPSSQPTMVMQNTSANCLILGGPRSGKTSLLISYDRGAFLNTSMPTELVVERTITKQKNNFKLTISDCGPTYRILDLTPHTVSTVDVVVLCFDVADRSSLQTAQNIWNYIELQSHFEGCCFPPGKCKNSRRPRLIVVGCQCDKRYDQDVIFELFDSEKTFVSSLEGEQFANSINADMYCEASALYHDGVDELFNDIYVMFNPTAFTRMVKRPFRQLCQWVAMPEIIPCYF